MFLTFVIGITNIVFASECFCGGFEQKQAERMSKAMCS